MKTPLNYLAFAIPLFVICMLLEWWAARRKNLPYFRLHNSVANVSVGIAERMTDVLVTGLFFFVYDYLQHRWGIFNIKPGVFLWILLLLCTDFLWYWYHRLAHEINVFWAVHVVHHQSEDFNYTVAARITVFQAFVRTGFWCVLPIIGFPASMITGILLVHGLYPFFIHTRMIGQLGILEYIFVTPSHHRVHHASNQRYLDKNYGDVFILWDKLFGTFAKEDSEEPVVYGLTKPLRSYSFLWQHFHFWVELWIAAREVRGFRNKWKVFFGKPDVIPPTARMQAEALFHISRQQDVEDRPLNRYVIGQVIVTLVALFLFVLLEHFMNGYTKLAMTLLILLTMVNCGAIMEQKRWVFYLEFSRLMLAGIICILTEPSLWLRAVFVLSVALLIHYAEPIRRHYFKWVYLQPLRRQGKLQS